MAAVRSSWICGICSVVFDIDVGNRVDACVPVNCLSAEEKQDVAFHSFPDSMSYELHARTSIRDSSFFFRIKRRGDSSKQVVDDQPVDGGGGSPATEQFLYGFVFCRQRQDPALPRGGEQVSVVILAEHPFSSMLRPLSQVAGSLYFSAGNTALEQVYSEVSCWPAPAPGPLLSFQVGYTTVTGRVPSMHSMPFPSAVTAPEQFPSQPISRSVSRTILGGVSTSSAPRTTSLLDLQSTVQQQSLHASSTHHREASQASAMSRTSSVMTEELPSGTQLSPLGSQTVPDAALPSPSSADNLRAQADVNLSRRTSLALSTDGEVLSRRTSSNAVASLLHRTSSDAPPQQFEPVSTQAVQHTSQHARTPSDHLTADFQGYDSTKLQGHHSLSPNTVVAPPVGRRLTGGAEGHSVHSWFGEVDIFTPLCNQLQRLWQLWELALLGKPLMVVALDPSTCSAAVGGLISLIAPLPYACDFRPYYTIQDPSFRDLQQGRLPGGQHGPLPCLIGLTNVFCIRALPHWPNILAVGQKDAGSNWQSASSPATMLLPGNAVKALRLRAQGAQALLAGHTEHLWSSYKHVTRPDQALLARLLQPKSNDVKSKVNRLAMLNSDAIRRHFFELTTTFLAPFQKYFEPDALGRVHGWNTEEFLITLRATPQPQLLLDRLGNVNAIVELYARFTTSLNFHAWFQLRRRPVQQLLEMQRLFASEHPAPRGFEAVEEVQMIGMFFDMEQQLLEARAEASAPDAPEEVVETADRLRREMLLLFQRMPQDLQQICLSNPARCQLLLSLGLDSAQQARVQALLAQLQQTHI